MWSNRLAYMTASLVTSVFQYRVFSHATARQMRFDLVRMATRARGRRIAAVPASPRLHIGAGHRRVPGWVNADLISEEAPIDLAAPLPWRDGVFEAIVGQHVIEHLQLEQQVLPVLRELHRVARPGAEIWLSTPDMEKVCRDYLQTGGQGLIDSWRARNPTKASPVAQFPASHMINRVFHQSGEHKNLFDFDLLRWTLEHTGFASCERADESAFLARFPAFPRRGDDFHTLYVRALKP
jgi:predicted SAM-dependent methyltransferase